MILVEKRDEEGAGPSGAEQQHIDRFLRAADSRHGYEVTLERPGTRKVDRGSLYDVKL